MKLEFLNVDENNKNLLEKIEVKQEQKSMVDLPIEAYEEAKKYKYSFPIVVLDETKVIAFFIYESLNDNFTDFLVWGFIVSSRFQHQNYGTQIMKQFLLRLKKQYEVKRIELAYVQGNTIAKKLYRKLGFKENGKINDDGEIEMDMNIG
jgi:diamine N-acetyltransferase